MSVTGPLARRAESATPFKQYFTDPARAEDGIRLVLRESRVTNYELTPPVERRTGNGGQLQTRQLSMIKLADCRACRPPRVMSRSANGSRQDFAGEEPSSSKSANLAKDRFPRQH